MRFGVNKFTASKLVPPPAGGLPMVVVGTNACLLTGCTRVPS